ncbi:Hypothetical protein A7982_10641 [Minicystis rosea]|nr:Hypothetical protein A7982_10641 [Minicystis rosea]
MGPDVHDGPRASNARWIEKRDGSAPIQTSTRLAYRAIGLRIDAATSSISSRVPIIDDHKSKPPRLRGCGLACLGGSLTNRL